jgi:hypothetical protein
MINFLNSNQVMNASVNIELGIQPDTNHNFLVKAIIKVANAIFSMFSSTYRSSREGLLQSNRTLNFDRHSMENGLSSRNLNDQEKVILRTLVETWENKSSAKTEWSAAELANYLEQETESIEKLLNLVCLKPTSEGNYSVFQINKLLISLKSEIDGESRLSCQPGTKGLWTGRFPVAAQLTGKGSDQQEWTVSELGRFLAVSQVALKQFLNGNKEQYSFREINDTFRNAQNRDINELLERNRTQENSIRWGMIA